MSEQVATGQDTGQATTAAAAVTATDKGAGTQTQTGQTTTQQGQTQTGQTTNGAAGTAAAGQGATQTQKPGSAATGDGEDTREAPATFPDDWADQMAGGDPKVANVLKRFRSPSSLAKSYIDLRTKLSQGAHLKDKPGEDATPEEKAAWAAQQGIPESPDGYEKGFKPPEGMVLSDADKQLAKGFYAHVHAKGWPQDKVNDAMGWYLQFQSDQQAARQDADLDFQAEAIRELKTEMGPADYRRGIQSIGALRQFEPEEGMLNAILDHARMPDGRKLGDIPGVVRMVMAWAGEIDPTARIAPADGNMSSAGMEARIAEIEGWMNSPTDSDKYWQNDAVQKEYGKLLEAKQKVASRRAA